MDGRVPVTKRLRKDELDVAAAILRGGGTVAFPTETVYGLGARGLDEACIQRIYDAKGRPADNPLILHVASLDDAWPLWSIPDERTRARIVTLAAAFWPGPLTIVALRSDVVPPRATAGLPKVAVRVPAHDVARALIARVGEPLAAPSANASTRPSPTTAQHVLLSLDGAIDAVIDGGPCEHGLESTVVDVARDVPMVLRSGALTLTTLRAVLPDLIERGAGAAAKDDDAAPGLRHRHYAPAVDEVRVVDGTALRAAWSGGDAVVVRAATAAALGPRAGATFVLPDDATGFGCALYAALYQVERAAPRRALLEDVPDDDDAWRAARDRLLRAAAR